MAAYDQIAKLLMMQQMDPMGGGVPQEAAGMMAAPADPMMQMAAKESLDDQIRRIMNSPSPPSPKQTPAQIMEQMRRIMQSK